MSNATIQLKTLKKRFETPDYVKTFNNGTAEFVELEGQYYGKVTLQPGWSWSKDLQPLLKTKSCEAAHLQYVISGRLRIVMDDQTELHLTPGDLVSVAAGHDARVIGNEPFVALEFGNLKEIIERVARGPIERRQRPRG
jgi:hypothetical protein